MFRNFLLVAWRNITRNRLYTTIHILGLGVGICACMAIWIITHYQLSFDKFQPDRDRIYRVVTEIGQITGEHQHLGNIPEPAEPAIRNEVTGLETVAQFHNINPLITIPGEHGQLMKFPKTEGHVYNDVVLAEPEYFDIFHYQWLAGDAATLKEPFHVVLTASEAQRYFGHSAPGDVLGRTIIYDDSISVTVTGIVKDLDRVTDFGFKDFISYATGRARLANDLALDSWSNTNSNSETFVKLAKGVSADRVNAGLKVFTDRHRNGVMGAGPSFLRFQLQPLSDLHYNTTVYGKDFGTQADLTTLYQLMGVAVFILILASINFINLSTAQSLRRAKEIGIRKVLGSRKAALVLQFMSETLLLALFALVLSLLLLRPVLAAFPSFVPAGLTFSLLDPATIGTTVGVVLLAVLLSGLYPALILSGYQPAESLKGQGGSKGRGQNWLGKSLVVFQFTISAVFIIGAIVVGNQIRYMLHKDMGFNQAAIIRFNANYKDSASRKDRLAQMLRTLPGVGRVSRDAFSPTMGGRAGTILELKPGTKTMVDLRMGDTNYLPLYGLKLLAGRNYFLSDTLNEVVVNATLAKVMGCRRPEDALGQLPMWGKHLTIVGVVADFSTRSAQYAIGPTLIFPQPDREDGFSVKLRTEDKTAADVKRTIGAIEKEWKSAFPDEPFRYTWVDESIQQLYEQEEKTSELINLAMVITIVISCMGLWGLAALSAQRRTKEIGIRKVLGAAVPNLIVLITRDFVLLVGLALVIASPLAFYLLHHWLQDYQYRVGIGWDVFALAAIGALGIALLTVGWHALRAAWANPVKSLRSE